MTGNQSGPRLIGEKVIVSYVADPAVGHGKFRVENPGAVAVTASVAAAWLEIGGQRQPLVGITVFDKEQEQMVNPESFNIDAKATKVFLIGFARVALQPHFGESITVGLKLNVNSAELQASSPIVLERRIPLGH